MPIPASEGFSPEMLQLIEHVERSLHHISRQVETREQAIAVKQRVLGPVGIINSRFGLRSSSPPPWRNGLTSRPAKD